MLTLLEATLLFCGGMVWGFVLAAIAVRQLIEGEDKPPE